MPGFKNVVNVLILLAALAGVFAFIEDIFCMKDRFEDLACTTGVVESKEDASYESGDEKKSGVLIKLFGDPQPYWASREYNYIHNHLTIGDSVRICIKKDFSKNWNAVVDESSIRFASNPREIFHLVQISNQYLIIDFDENQKSLRKMVWIFPLFSLLLFGWFLYRWLGQKSMFVLESGG